MTEFTEDADGLPSGPLSAQQASADAADLRAGIDDLAGLVAGSLGLPELLTEVSTFAVHAIPGADGAGGRPKRAKSSTVSNSWRNCSPKRSGHNSTG